MLMENSKSELSYQTGIETFQKDQLGENMNQRDTIGSKTGWQIQISNSFFKKTSSSCNGWYSDDL